MLNGKTVNVKIKRHELIDLMMACTELKFAFKEDLANAKDNDAKRIAEGGMRKWENLHEILKQQLNAFDESHKDDAE